MGQIHNSSVCFLCDLQSSHSSIILRRPKPMFSIQNLALEGAVRPAGWLGNDVARGPFNPVWWLHA